MDFKVVSAKIILNDALFEPLYQRIFQRVFFLWCRQDISLEWYSTDFPRTHGMVCFPGTFYVLLELFSLPQICHSPQKFLDLPQLVLLPYIWHCWRQVLLHLSLSMMVDCKALERMGNVEIPLALVAIFWFQSSNCVLPAKGMKNLSCIEICFCHGMEWIVVLTFS